MYSRFQFTLLINYSPYCLILLFILSGCNYDPDDEYIVNIERPLHPAANMILNNQDSVITIWRSTDFVYSFSSPNEHKVVLVNVYVDDELIKSSSSSSTHVDFIVDIRRFSAGRHIIRIITTTNTATGSLADRIGAEELVFTKEWILVVLNTWPESYDICITDMNNENGLLKVSWEKFGKPDFEKYELYSSPVINKNGFLPYTIIASITDSSNNYFYDSSYVGGLKPFYLILTAGDGSYGHYIDKIDTVSFPFPTILSAQSQGYDSRITFSKCLFPVAFKEYRLSIRYDEYTEFEKGIIDNISDTSILIHDLFFGSSYTLKLATYPVNIDYDNADIDYEPTSKFQSYIGDTSFVFAQAEALPTGDAIYFTQGYDVGTLYKLSPVNGEVSEVINQDEENCNVDFKMSADGAYLFYRDQNSNISRLLKLPEMTEVAIIENLPHVPGSSRISNNGLVPVITEHELMIYNLVEEKYSDTLYTNYTGYYQGGTYYGSDSYISPDGNYLYVQTIDFDTIYRRSGDNFIPEVAFGPAFSFVAFNPLGSNELIVYTGQELNVLECETMTVKKTYSHVHPPFSNIDPVTGYFLALDNSEERIFGVYDISDGSKVGSVRIAYNVSPESLRLYNSVLYSSNGYKIRVTP